MSVQTAPLYPGTSQAGQVRIAGCIDKCLCLDSKHALIVHTADPADLIFFYVCTGQLGMKQYFHMGSVKKRIQRTF